MALTLPYPDMNFVPLDVLTAAEQNQLVANIEYIASQFPDTNVYTGSFTMETGYTKQDSVSFIKKVGNVVNWQLRFTNTSQINANSEVQVATISNGFRPPQSIWVNGTISSADNTFYVSVLENGKIYIKPGNNISANSVVIISGTYFV